MGSLLELLLSKMLADPGTPLLLVARACGRNAQLTIMDPDLEHICNEYMNHQLHKSQTETPKKFTHFQKNSV